MFDIQQTAFLPIDRLASIAQDAAARYHNAVPYPHVVIDDFFDPDLLMAVHAEFPRPDEITWHHYNNRFEDKLVAHADEMFPPLTKALMQHLNSATFLDFLSEVTGIKDLIADAYYEGGGMHQITRGGKLSIHADFNHHPGNKLDRRLNVIVYLNPDWKEEYGSYLELWNKDMTACQAKIAPIFNRMFIFSTNEFTFHGHPGELNCPEGMTRKSLAWFYFTNGRPAEEKVADHSTNFQLRPGERLHPPMQVVKDTIKDFLPPVLTRFISRHTGKRA